MLARFAPGSHFQSVKQSELSGKLQIKAGMRVGSMNAPEIFAKKLSPLPEGAELSPVAPFDHLTVFVNRKAEVERFAPGALKSVRKGGILWFAYPKKGSGARSDVSRDDGWETVKKAGWDVVSLIAVDSTWAALRFRPMTELEQEERQARRDALKAKAAEQKKAAEENSAEIPGADAKREPESETKPAVKRAAKPAPKKRTKADKAPDKKTAAKTPAVVVPPDLKKALSAKPKAKLFFEQLAPSHRREYINWIVEAKKPATRASRVQKTIVRLTSGRKNPSPE